MSIKVVESYDGRLPVYNVIKEVLCDNCNKIVNEVIGSFETYAEADLFADTVTIVEDNID